MKQLLGAGPAELDLTDATHLDGVRALADRLLAVATGPEVLADLEREACADVDAYPLSGHLAVKLARSRRLLESLGGPMHLSVVFAVYKEHHRIRTRAEHPNGEDFLRRKLEQLDWLFRGIPDSGWDLRVVDDGCPEGSGRLAEEIAATHPLGERVRVLRLADAIEEGLPVAAGLETTADSQKGGSVLYGMWDAVREERAGHAVLFTDADLSTHLGQAGLLLGPLLRGRASAIGSRREPESVVVKKGVRNVRGKLFIYLWKRLVHTLEEVVDSQCGFKAFRADVVRRIVEPSVEKRFAFDLELLVRTQLLDTGGIEKVPVAWIDSDAESTTTELSPYLSMLQAVAGVYRTYLPSHPQSDAFARFLEDLDEDGWNRLVERVPVEIASSDPARFGRFDGVSVEALRAAAAG